MLYPRQCDACGKILKHRSSFSRHKSSGACIPKENNDIASVHRFFQAVERGISTADAQTMLPLVLELEKTRIKSAVELVERIDASLTTTSEIMDALTANAMQVMHDMTEAVESGLLQSSEDNSVTLFDAIFHCWRQTFFPQIVDHGTEAVKDLLVQQLCRRAIRNDIYRGDDVCQERETITVDQEGQLYTYADHMARNDNVDDDEIYKAFLQKTRKTNRWSSRSWRALLLQHYQQVRDVITRSAKDICFLFSDDSVPSNKQLQKMKAAYIKDAQTPLMRGWSIMRGIIDR